MNEGVTTSPLTSISYYYPKERYYPKDSNYPNDAKNRVFNDTTNMTTYKSTLK